MSKRTSFFILLFLSSLILISFFPGCLPVTPVTVTGTISGYVAIPDETSKDLTGYSPIPGATVTIVDADGVTHTVLTDENGYYYFNNISIKTNTIINITKDTEGGGKLIFKDIVPLVVSQEEDYDAGIADAESTAIALVVESLVNLGQVQEEIGLDEITSSDGFDKLKEDIQQAQEDNQDFTTDNPINTQAEEIADNIINPSELEPSPSPTPEPTPTYTVTFDSQGGSAVDSQTVEYGGLVTKPADPTRTGYTFGGWYKESGCTTPWVFATDTVTSNITLYAKWTINSYTVTFDSQSATVAADPTSKTVIAPATTVGTLPTPPSKTGYEFGGWYTETIGSGTEFTASTNVAADITVYAKWTINSYFVTYNGNGNTAGTVPVDPSSSYDYGATVTVLGNTGSLVKTQDGISLLFTGWNTAADGSGNGGTDYTAGGTFNMGSADVTLYAQWSVLRGTGPAGGLIFYINPNYVTDGWRYLEAAPSDQSTGIQWYNGSFTTTGATGLVLGTGSANTTTIITSQGATAISYAAGLARAYTGGSKTDWFLPSKDELDKMWINLKKGTDENSDTYTPVGGFADYSYWSSSEFNASYAWYQDFSNGNQNYYFKYDAGRVRAVRKF